MKGSIKIDGKNNIKIDAKKEDTMKKLFTLVLSLMLVLSLVGCGDKKEAASEKADTETSEQAGGSVESTQQAESDTEEAADDSSDAEEKDPAAEAASGALDMSEYAGTKTGSFYSRFPDGKIYMEYEMDAEGQSMNIITATNGDKTYSEVLMNGASTGETIMDGEYMYTIDHASKMVIKMALQTGTQQELVDTMIEEDDVNMDEFKTGSRTIEGKTYDTEEWVMDEMTSIMCFDGDEIVYIVVTDGTEEQIIKIVEISGNVDDSLFEIPAGYQVLEM